MFSLNKHVFLSVFCACHCDGDKRQVMSCGVEDTFSRFGRHDIAGKIIKPTGKLSIDQVFHFTNLRRILCCSSRGRGVK